MGNKSNWMRMVGAAVSLAVVGCSTTANVQVRNGTTLEGEIVGGNERRLVLETNNRNFSVDREDIVDIDHPGNAVGTVGVILTAYGILNIAVGAPKCSEKGGAFCTGVFLPATLGLGMTVWGFVVYSRSLKAAESGEARRNLSSWMVTPTYRRVGSSDIPGLSLVSTF